MVLVPLTTIVHVTVDTQRTIAPFQFVTLSVEILHLSVPDMVPALNQTLVSVLKAMLEINVKPSLVPPFRQLIPRSVTVEEFVVHTTSVLVPLGSLAIIVKLWILALVTIHLLSPVLALKQCLSPIHLVRLFWLRFQLSN